MFILLVMALLMVFAGSTFLEGVIAKPVTFIVYWGICGWLTLAAMLLAVWDMFLLRAATRREKRTLKEMLDHLDEDPNDP